jgi:hypothetical protein
MTRHTRGISRQDISQTDGEPLPDVAPNELRGAAPDRLWDRLVMLAEADGFTVERGPCGGAYGITDFRAMTVRVRDDVDPAQATKTLAHELGHIRADHAARFLERYHESINCRGWAEVEAESIATSSPPTPGSRPMTTRCRTWRTGRTATPTCSARPRHASSASPVPSPRS